MAAIQWPRGDTYVEDWKLTRPAVQDIVIEGTPAAGTFVLTVPFPTGPEATAPIAFNANAAAVQTALEGLPSVDAGDVTVTGGPGPGTKWTGTWATATAYTMTAAGTFSGGSNPLIYVRRQAFSLVGATVRWTLKSPPKMSQTDAQADIAHRWTDGGTVSPAGCIVVAVASSGKAVHTLTSAVTGALVPGTTYKYDTQVTDANSVTTTVDSGTFVVTEDVTLTVP